MIDEETLKIALNDKSFSKDEAVSIVGGMARFIELCESGRIRYSKSTSAQNSRWKCNAWDVICHAQLKYNTPKQRRWQQGKTCMVAVQNTATI